MLEELRQAKHFIFLEYFIVAEGKMWETILEILKQKAEEGLDVRMIYDDMGCLTCCPPLLRRTGEIRDKVHGL